MPKKYRLTTHADDPELILKLPQELVKDLVQRSQENGRSINIELAMRLARSLEGDLVLPNSSEFINNVFFKNKN
ncbi:MAG: Arc family DNA-binding protein [Gammaproteobacteria bacterium]|nr:Arc family DNA-binding protein [Gammaproteobacteria bacterium]